MPSVRKTGGPEVAIRDMGRFRPGETYEVDRETAEYLTSERDFLYVKEDTAGGDGTPEDTDASDAEDTTDGDVPSEDAPEQKALSELTHDELKDLAESEGIAEEIDLRSKESIIDALGD